MADLSWDVTFDSLPISMEQAAALPDGVARSILQAGADVLVQAQKAVLSALGLVASRTLSDSIRSFYKQGDGGGGRHMLVYPYGKHHTYTKRSKTFKRSRHGRKTKGGYQKEATADEVGFALEFGTKRNPAFQWMERANESCVAELVEAEQQEYNNYMQGCGL